MILWLHMESWKDSDDIIRETIKYLFFSDMLSKPGSNDVADLRMAYWAKAGTGVLNSMGRF